MSDVKGQHEPSMEEILASIRRIIAEDGDAAPADSAPAVVAAPAPARPVEPPIDEILELTEVVEDDGSVVRFGSRPAEPEPPPRPPIAAFDFDDEPPPPPPPRSEPADRLVSDATAAASVAALSHLVARGQRDELPIGAPGRTLEDMIRELIRPMLKDWLDDNLPYVVERIVKEEIARLVRDAQGH
jgi:cell pole-organizing protein PopZ